MISIWAPHPDDEIIGCFYVLRQNSVEVYYGEIDEGCARSSKMFGFVYHRFYDRVLPWDIVFAPDPSVDMHPEHQRFGHLAQSLFRSGKINRLLLYCTSMNASYIWEVPDSIAKREALNYCYPGKSDLWRYDHKWFLFEGYVEWCRLIEHRLEDQRQLELDLELIV